MVNRSSGKRGDTLRSTLQRGEPALLGGCLPRHLLPSCTIGGVHLKNLPGIRDDINFAIGTDYRRRPITALASKGFWNGVTELKDVLSNPRNPLASERQETAKFYIKESTLKSQHRKTQKLLEKLHDEGFDDNFFEDITTLHRRQNMLFQRCCEQLKDIYETESEDMMNGKDEINVSVPFLTQNGGKKENNVFGTHITTSANSRSSDCEEDEKTNSVKNAKNTIATMNNSSVVICCESTVNTKITNDNFRNSSGNLEASKSNRNGNRNDNNDNNLNGTFPKVSPFGEVDMAGIEELYTEILYAILNSVGCDAPNQQEQINMMEHLRRSFRVPPNKHVKLFEIATTTEKPERKLNISVLGAKNLAGKDNLASSLEIDVSKGDPFVTFYLKSKPFDVKNTNTHPPSLNPVWKENFVLKLDELR